MLYAEVIRDRNGCVLHARVMSAAEIEERHRTADYLRMESRNDWRTYEEAQTVANALNRDAGDLHNTFQATNAGPYVSPRYDVIDLPRLGDEVSYTFNGDYYPCGRIAGISAGPGYRCIVAVDDNGSEYKFWRRCRDGKPTGGAWIMRRTWSMIQGHHNKRNPEF
jgi:hypothetical protein